MTAVHEVCGSVSNGEGSHYPSKHDCIPQAASGASYKKDYLHQDPSDFHQEDTNGPPAAEPNHTSINDILRQPCEDNLSTEQEQLLPLSQRLAMLSMKPLDQEETESDLNQNVNLPDQGQDAELQAANQPQSEKMPLDECPERNIGIHTAVNVERTTPVLNVASCSSQMQRKVHEKNGNKHRYMHLHVDFSSILEHSSMNDSLDVDSLDKKEENGKFSMVFEGHLSKPTLFNQAEETDHSQTDNKSVNIKSEYSSTPASTEGHPAVFLQSLVSPITMTFDRSSSPQLKGDIGNDSAVHSTKSGQMKGTDQLRMSYLSDAFTEHEDNCLGNFLLQASVLNDCSCSSGFGHGCGMNKAHTEKASQHGMVHNEECTDEDANSLDHRCLTTDEKMHAPGLMRNTRLEGCTISNLHETHSGVNGSHLSEAYDSDADNKAESSESRGELVENGKDQVHQMGHEKNHRDKRSSKSVITLIRTPFNRTISKCETSPNPSPVLLSLTDRLKLKLQGGATGRSVLSSLARGLHIKGNMK